MGAGVELPPRIKAALSTEGKMMTHSALSSRSGGMSSGMFRISFRTVPQLSRRSVSFLSSFAERGRATRAHVTRDETNRLSTKHLVVVFWAGAIIECPGAPRNHGLETHPPERARNSAE